MKPNYFLYVYFAEKDKADPKYVTEQISLADQNAWEEWKQRLEVHSMEYEISEIKIFMISYFLGILSQKEGEEFQSKIIQNLLILLEAIEKYPVYLNVKKISLEINDQHFQTIQPLLRRISNMHQLQKLQIKTLQQLSSDDMQLLEEIISTKLINLEVLDLDIFGTQSKNESIEYQQKQYACKLNQMSFRINNNFDHLRILKLFPNLETLKLIFPLILRNPDIDSSLARISQVAPQLTNLQMLIESEAPCILASTQRLQNLQQLSIEFGGMMTQSELKLQQFKHLSSFDLKCIDPLSYFCSQQNMSCLKKVTLFNIGGYAKGSSKDKRDIEHFSKVIQSHKLLEKVSLESSGYNSGAQKCFQRDIEIVSSIINQLKRIRIKWTQKIKQIDQDFASALALILNRSKSQTKIQLNFSSWFSSLEAELDLALAIRSLKYPELFSLFINEVSIFSEEKLSEMIKSASIYITWHASQIQLGIIGSLKLLSSKLIVFNILSYEKFLISKNSQKEKNIQAISKIKELLSPFHNIELKQFNEKELIQFQKILSSNIVSLQLNYHLPLQYFDILSNHFPKLSSISCISLDQQHLANHLPSKNLNLKCSLEDNNLNQVLSIFQIKGHFLQVLFKPQTFKSWQDVKLILKNIIENENRILFLEMIEKQEVIKNEQANFITSYSQQIKVQVITIPLFLQQIASLIPLNPKRVYYDLFF